jgi:hypothetical protein
VVVPCLLQSLVVVPARPLVIGNEACVWSSAWMEVFSSIHNTTAP